MIYIKNNTSEVHAIVAIKRGYIIFKPDFNNLSQGERLRFVRGLRYMPKPYVAEHFQLGNID